MNFDFEEIFGQKIRNFRLDFIMIIKIQIGKVYYKKKGQFPEFCPSLFCCLKLPFAKKSTYLPKSQQFYSRSCANSTFGGTSIIVIFEFSCYELKN